MEVAVLDLILSPSALTAGLQQPHEYQSHRCRGVTTQDVWFPAHVFSRGLLMGHIEDMFYNCFWHVRV